MKQIKTFTDVCEILDVEWIPVRFKRLKMFLNDYTPWTFNVEDQFSPQEKLQMIASAFNALHGDWVPNWYSTPTVIQENYFYSEDAAEEACRIFNKEFKEAFGG